MDPVVQKHKERPGQCFRGEDEQGSQHCRQTRCERKFLISRFRALTMRSSTTRSKGASSLHSHAHALVRPAERLGRGRDVLDALLVRDGADGGEPLVAPHGRVRLRLLLHLCNHRF